MKYIHHLAIDEPTLPKAQFHELYQLKPEGRRATGFRIDAVSRQPDGDEFIRHALEILKTNGVPRRVHSSATSYGHTVTRLYEEIELKEAEFLVLTCRVVARTGVIDGRAVLAADPAYRLTSVLNFTRPVVVSDEVRQLLKGGMLVGLEFGAAPLNPDPDCNWGRIPGPFWEIQSSIALPKMSNTHQFVHPGRTQTEPFRGDYSKIIMISDPPFSKGEVRYRREDIDALASFDIARTFEKHMNPYPALVVSQRFYQYCLANGIGLSADPVRIDPE